MRGIERRIYGGSRLPWIWHAMVDGTKLCRCPHSRWVQGDGPGPREVRAVDGTVVDIVYDGPSMRDSVPDYRC